MTINTTYSGILNIDKPQGLTSHDVVGRVRRISNMRKVGHAGTLDPLATGVLLVMLGKTTRLMEYAHDFKKTYLVTITFGGTSDTDDAMGVISKIENPEEPNELSIQKAFSHFLGDIQQIPPTYAAIKVKGKKLYEYARQNQIVERKPRPVTIYNIELLNYSYPTLDIRVTCSSGTYIRSLARDLGEKLNTGAYLSQLRREAIGPFTIKEAIKLETLTSDNIENYLLKPEKLVHQLPSITLSPEDIVKADYGLPIPYTNDSLLTKQPVALFADDNSLIGIGHYDKENALLHPKKILH